MALSLTIIIVDMHNILLNVLINVLRYMFPKLIFFIALINIPFDLVASLINI